MNENDPEVYIGMLESHDDRAHHHERSDHDPGYHQKHHDHEHHHHDHHSDHLANDGFISVSFTSDRPFLKNFQDFLDNLTTDIFRAKGVLRFQESHLKHIFQLSSKRCTLDAVPVGTKPLVNQLVLIGRNLNANEIQQRLSNCLASSSARPSMR